MTNLFFEKPILNSPYALPGRHWELDTHGQPTNRIVEQRRRAEFITPIPKPKKRRGAPVQEEIVFNEATEVSSADQRYETMSIVNDIRRRVDAWRKLQNPSDWRVTPETARLLQHWRHHAFGSFRPFFCQIEAAETMIWLAEVAPNLGKEGRAILDHFDAASEQSNPGLLRIALKLATGAGKTTVMAMLIAWQTVNAVRRPSSKKFTRGFLVVTPGITIRDRLRVLLPNDPDMASTRAEAKAYVIKITLVANKPCIWRRFCVPGEISLDRLHDIIQIVMGWQETHLHRFEIDGRRYAEKLEDIGDDGLLEAGIRLCDLIVAEKAKFFYEYDFGDAWCHELQVDRIDEIPKGHCLRVTCLDGKRSCPPEDVGGIDGYAELLRAIKNSRHPEHESFREWAGDDFDPAQFDIDEVNMELAKYARWSRPRALDQDLQVPRI